MADPNPVQFGPFESAALADVVASGRLWRGNGTGWGSRHDSAADDSSADRLEDAFAQWIGLPYVHAVNSGTSANEAAVVGLGLEPGDEVICPAACPAFVPFAVLAAGCIPVFADVHPETLLLLPDAVERVASEKTRAVVAVHLWGLPAPMADVLSIARPFGWKVVEDCAQALGTMVADRPVGTFGDACCFSLQQSKHITSGEGGIFATKDPETYTRAVVYSSAGVPHFRFGLPTPRRQPGSVGRGHIGFGHNHRISEMQAAVALAQLSRLDEFNRRRAELVRLLEQELDRRHDAPVRTLKRPSEVSVSYWRYPVLVPAGQGTFKEIPYLEPAFQRMNSQRRTPFGLPLPEYVTYAPGSCPQAERGAAQVRALSVHQSLTDDQLLASLDAMLADLSRLRHVRKP
ncbi:DegT/DnrJ/EryC1/StrS family aminotransferase [Streptomyces sp. CL7]|uniref:DegT/DnrJ/EryC1/StrS family aminotransferase n=1 Tax=Streptomyces sp. CL7 TaxID=3096006 RepID=UPI002A750A5C|nr:DegT/DnrJ/EryC1/StrS family aminotransferase [Streptomyces sp. CL7]WPP33388.1 DegT/DnrJ/EryC1/StrS family aminotransferase [Streptomyces sp. CL7]